MGIKDSSDPRLKILEQAMLSSGVDMHGLMPAVGGDILLLANLLSASNGNEGTGSAALRLKRVLDANPGVPRTLADLQPLIDAQKSIDEKILTGRFDGREMIGGHSPEVINDPSIQVDKTVHNGNGTDYVSYRKLIQQDTGNHAGKVASNDPQSLTNQVGNVDAIAGAVAAQAAPTWPPKMPQHIKDARKASYDKALVDLQSAIAQLQVSMTAVNNTATDAAANPADASKVSPFADNVKDMFANADAIVSAIRALEGATGSKAGEADKAKAILETLKTQFQTDGPMFSAKKNKTLAPNGWTNDQILLAGDQTASEPATLIRDRVNSNAPVHGATVQTMHQKMIGGVMWVVIKDGVTYTTPPPTLTGGTVTSSYPTQGTSIPTDPIVGDTNDEGFGPLH
jgi:hypothetical protein